MKKFLSVAVPALLLSVSCQKGSDSTGNIIFEVKPVTEIDVVTRSSVSDYTVLPSASDFNIKVLNSKSAIVWEGGLDEYDSQTSFKTGSYSVSASYGLEGDEGFDKPYFCGTADFIVESGETSTVSVPVSLGNCLVKINCSDIFKSYFPDYSFTLTTGSGTVVDFSKEETRAAFIDAFKFSVSARMKSQGGALKTYSKSYDSGILPATCYTLAFDVTNAGGVSLTVSFNDTVDVVDLGDIELND